MDKRVEKIKQTILGNYKNLDDAIKDTQYTSQLEAYLRLLYGDNIFITGPAGSGKSYVVKEYCKILKQLNPKINIEITSTTGLSASNINGSTIHSFLGVGLNQLSYKDYKQSLSTKLNEEISKLEEELNRKATINERVGIRKKIYSSFEKSLKRLKNTDVLIIDEISMMSARLFSFLEKMIEESESELQLIVSGDFSQLPPVAKKQDLLEYGEDLGKFCYGTESWNKFNFTVCYLDKLYRAKDLELAYILNNISLGKGKEIKKELDKLPTTTNKFKKGSALLLSTNWQVDSINENQQKKNKNKLYTNEIEYINQNDKDDKRYKKAVKLAKQSNTPEILKLKIGDTIMCTRNIRVDKDNILVNGQRNHPLTEKVQLLRNGMIGTFVYNKNRWGIEIPFNSVTIEYLFDEPYMFTEEPKLRKDKKTGEIYEESSRVWFAQYPFKLAYAITIHKSQGQTFSHITIDLNNSWTEGLGYVALSRAMNITGITLLENEYGYKYNNKALEINSESLKIKKDTQIKANENRRKYYKVNKAILDNFDDFINKKD